MLVHPNARGILYASDRADVTKQLVDAFEHRRNALSRLDLPDSGFSMVDFGAATTLLGFGVRLTENEGDRRSSLLRSALKEIAVRLAVSHNLSILFDTSESDSILIFADSALDFTPGLVQAYHDKYGNAPPHIFPDAAFSVVQ